MVSVTIREAQPSDIDAIAGLTNAAFAVERFFTSVDRTSPERLRALTATGTMLVAEDDNGRLAGSVYAEIRGDRVYIGLLAVEPSQQSRGIGRSLMDAAESYGRARGCTAADITVVNLRTELPPFYQRLGYTEMGTQPFDRDEPVTKHCHFILMSKSL